MRRASQFLKVALRPDTAWRALRMALVVGPILILVNQWNALTGDAAFSPWQAMLTVLVPYCVSTWTAASQETSGTPSR